MKKSLIIIVFVGITALNLGAMETPKILASSEKNIVVELPGVTGAEKSKEVAATESKKSAYKEWKARYMGDQKFKSPEALYQGVIKLHQFPLNR